MHWLALQPLPEEPGAPDERGASSAPVPALADVLSALAWCLLQFTPRVAQVGPALVLEVSGSERLFGGRPALLRRMGEAVQALAPVVCAQGPTSLVALARLQVEDNKQLPDQLPLHTLAAAVPHLPTLERLGCRCWGQLRALPRAGLVRRFDAALVAALDRAYGQQPEVYPWLVWPEAFDLRLELPMHVESAPALMFAAHRLLAQLQVWLRARQRGVLVFDVVWQLDARRHVQQSEGSVRISTATPTLDVAHLQRLLSEHLARLSLPAPAVSLRLRTQETAPLAGTSASLLPDEQRKGDDWPQMLERLVARLGPQQVLQAQACADHRPERMQQWRSAVAPGAARATPSANIPASPLDALYPSWLLEPPLKLDVPRGSGEEAMPHYQGDPLRLLAGPQRLEAGWWDVGSGTSGACGPTSVLRDYFIAHSAQAGLLWVYRRRPLGAPAQGEAVDWYLHGLFA